MSISSLSDDYHRSVPLDYESSFLSRKGSPLIPKVTMRDMGDIEPFDIRPAMNRYSVMPDRDELSFMSKMGNPLIPDLGMGKGTPEILDMVRKPQQASSDLLRDIMIGDIGAHKSTSSDDEELPYRSSRYAEKQGKDQKSDAEMYKSLPPILQKHIRSHFEDSLAGKKMSFDEWLEGSETQVAHKIMDKAAEVMEKKQRSPVEDEKEKPDYIRAMQAKYKAALDNLDKVMEKTAQQTF